MLGAKTWDWIEIRPRIPSLSIRASVSLPFIAACLAAHAGFPEDIFSARVEWPLLVVKVVCGIIVAGILIGARGLGRSYMRSLGVENDTGAFGYFLSSVLGIALLSSFLHLLSAFHVLRFEFAGPLSALFVMFGAPVFLNDVKHAWNRLMKISPIEVVGLGFFLIVVFPVAIRASLPFFINDEMTMYLPQLRGFVRQGSFDPLLQVEMLNTFTTGGFSLLTLAYALGGDGTAIYLSFAYLALTSLGIYGILKEFGRSRLAAFGPALLFLFAQVIIADHINAAGFIDEGMGLSKLHSITALCVLGGIASFILYLRNPGRATGAMLALVLSFTAGIQFLGLALIGVSVAALLLMASFPAAPGQRALHFQVAILSGALSLLWYLKPWVQVGSPFPAAIAPVFLTDLFLSNHVFYPLYYNHHFKHIFMGQEAMLGMNRPLETLPILLRQAPFNLIALALPACLFLRLSGFSPRENKLLKGVLVLFLVLIFLKVPNPRYFLFVLPVFSVILLAVTESIGEGISRTSRYSARVAGSVILLSLVLFSQWMGIPYSQVWTLRLDPVVAEDMRNMFLMPLPEMQRMLQSWYSYRVGSTVFWARTQLPRDSRILHNNIDNWYFSGLSMFQMSATLGAPSYQPSIKNIIVELKAAGITHFFFSYRPLHSCPDHSRFYTPLYEEDNFRRYFKLVRKADDGLLFRFFPEGVGRPDPEFLLPIRVKDLDVRVWR